VDDYAHSVTPGSLAARQERARRTRRLNGSRTADGAISLEGRLDPIDGETVLTALAPLAAPRGEDDDRTPEQRRADALVELARRSLDQGALPKVGGVRPHVTVVVDLPTLLGQPGAPAAQLDRLGAISGDAARRLACDAGICRVITNGRSQILDAGRSDRANLPHPPPQRNRPRPDRFGQFMLAVLGGIIGRCTRDWTLIRGPDGHWTARSP